MDERDYEKFENGQYNEFQKAPKVFQTNIETDNHLIFAGSLRVSCFIYSSCVEIFLRGGGGKSGLHVN